MASPRKPPIDVSAVSRAISRWFPKAARALPWRTERTPWRSLVSEAMLQQTQVDRVEPAFRRFLVLFPDPAALARADVDAVLAAWKGLGYYRRARALHAAAKQIVDLHGGEVPRSIAELRALPGVGAYTAGAVASIAFGDPEPIVDGNVARVFARLAAQRGPVGNREFDAWCWDQANRLVATSRRPAIVNEGIMELGALICTPKAPSCSRCPLRSKCAATKTDDPASFPTARAPAVRQTVHHHAVLVMQRGRVLLVKRGETGLWAGMWEPPTCESQRRLRASELRKRLPVEVSGLTHVEGFVHQTTHREVCFHFYVAESACKRDASAQWHLLSTLDELPLANPHRRMIDRAQALATR